MKLIAKIIGKGTPDDPYRVNLPTWEMIREITPRRPDGTFPPGATVEIEVPDDECDLNKKIIDKAKIRKKYAGQILWDRADVADDI